MITVIDNGKSRSVFNLSLLDNHVTYGCNVLYREYTPTHLVCGDGPMTWDICRSGYTVKNKCYFKMFDRLSAMQYEMLKTTFPPNTKIMETQPQTNEFVVFGDGGTMVIYWINPEETTESLEWWGENEEESYSSGTATLRLACLQNPNEEIYCIGFDYYLDRTADNIFLGTTFVQEVETENDRTTWISQHKRIEEEFDNKIYHVGKHMNYVEFENLLNK